MKTIRIKHFHRLPFLIYLHLSIAAPICLAFLVIGITDNIPELKAIVAIAFIALCVGFGFFLNYGIKISSKRVVLLNQEMFKIFRYEDVVYIKITFYNDNIKGIIKAKYEEPCEFCFDGIDLRVGRSRSYLWVKGLKFTQRFIDKSIAKLSTCEKVKIQNAYITQEK